MERILATRQWTIVCHRTLGRWRLSISVPHMNQGTLGILDLSDLSLLNTNNVRSTVRTVLVSFGSEKPRAREFPVRCWPPQKHQINSSGTPFQTFCLMLLLYSYLYLNIIPINGVNSHHLIKFFHQNFPKAEPRRFPRYCLHEMLRLNLFSLF